MKIGSGKRTRVKISKIVYVITRIEDLNQYQLQEHMKNTVIHQLKRERDDYRAGIRLLDEEGFRQKHIKEEDDKKLRKKDQEISELNDKIQLLNQVVKDKQMEIEDLQILKNQLLEKANKVTDEENRIKNL